MEVGEQERVMRNGHCIESAGHLGIEMTYDWIAREYYWLGISYDVVTFITECPECQRYKVSQSGPQGLMGRRNNEGPWVVVAADLMEFPRSKGRVSRLVYEVDLGNASQEGRWEVSGSSLGGVNLVQMGDARILGNGIFLNYGRHPIPVKNLRREVEAKTLKVRVEPEVWVDRVRKLDALRNLAIKFIEEAREK